MSTSIPNFAAQALTDLVLARNEISAFSSPGPVEAYYMSLHNIAISNLKDSIKFHLVKDGAYFEKPVPVDASEDLHIPYPQTALQFTFDVPDQSKHIILLSEEDTERWGKGFVMMQIPFLKNHDQWTIDPVPFFIPYNPLNSGIDPEAEKKALDYYLYDMKKPKNKLGRSKTVCYPLISTKHLEIISKANDSNPDKFMNDIIFENGYYLQVVAQFLSVLQCSNVTIEDYNPNSKMNANRVKHGKEEIFSYKVLLLDTHARPLSSESKSQGSHSSPITHLRRGHIRRLETKKIWVNSCVVNPGNGMLQKDYLVKKN